MRRPKVNPFYTLRLHTIWASKTLKLDAFESTEGYNLIIKIHQIFHFIFFFCFKLINNQNFLHFLFAFLLCFFDVFSLFSFGQSRTIIPMITTKRSMMTFLRSIWMFMEEFKVETTFSLISSKGWGLAYSGAAVTTFSGGSSGVYGFPSVFWNFYGS